MEIGCLWRTDERVACGARECSCASMNPSCSRWEVLNATREGGTEENYQDRLPRVILRGVLVRVFGSRSLPTATVGCCAAACSAMVEERSLEADQQSLCQQLYRYKCFTIALALDLVQTGSHEQGAPGPLRCAPEEEGTDDGGGSFTGSLGGKHA